MNPATHGVEGNAAAAVLYMALELSNKPWRLAFSDGAKRRQVGAGCGSGEACLRGGEGQGAFRHARLEPGAELL